MIYVYLILYWFVSRIVFQLVNRWAVHVEGNTSQASRDEATFISMIPVFGEILFVINICILTYEYYRKILD